ncbi:MAG: DUF3568 family protein [Nitrospirae bacterium]|nr:DUF3568 family protein [Nitrospirota bacterium]
MKKVVSLVVLIFAFVFSSGCPMVLVGAGVGAGVGTYLYLEGDLIREYPVAYSTAWDATNTALKNFNINVTHSVNDVGKGSIEAIRKDGQKVIIKLADKGNNVTSIRIRVGMFGSRDASEQIHEEIARVLGLR